MMEYSITTKDLENPMPKILYVEDNQDYVFIFTRQFGKYFIIDSVSDGNEAVEILQKQKFDAVITDFEMPGLNGLELLAYVKKNYPELPVIFYTAQGNEEIAREAFISGASDYFVKNLSEFVHKEKIANSIKNAIEKRKTREALRESEAKYRSFVQNFKGIAQWSRPGFDIVFVHGAVKEISGYSEEELINRNPMWHQIVHPDDLSFFISDTKKLEDISNVTFEREYRIIKKDGDICWVLENIQNVCDENGKPILIQSALYDITKRKQTEYRINHLNSILRAIKSIHHIVVREANKEILIKKVCDCFVKIRGYECARIFLFDENKNIALDYRSGKIAPDDPACINMDGSNLPPCVKALLDRGEVTLICKDPENCVKECSKDLVTKLQKYSLMITRLEHAGKVMGDILVSIPKLTEVDKEEEMLFKELADDIAYALHSIEIDEELRKERDFSKMLLQVAPAYFVAIDSENKLRFMNNAMIEALGYEPHDIERVNYIEKFIPEEEKELLFNLFRNLMQQKETVSIKNHVTSKKGKKLLVDWKGQAVFKENGEAEYFIGFGNDITEKTEAEKALKESENLFDEFFEKVPVGLAITAENGDVIAMNKKATEIFGYTRDDLKALKASSLYMNPEDRKIIAGLLKENGFLSRYKSRMKKKDGTAFIAIKTINAMTYKSALCWHTIFEDFNEYANIK